MNDQNNQDQMTPEDAKAALGLSTRLGEGMLVAEAPQDPQSPETAPGGEEAQKPEVGAEDQKLTDMEGKIDGKLEILRTELKDTIKNEVSSIKQMIQDALADDDSNEEEAA